ncbi:MAG: B12-binding domain-containing radical SAM protein [Rhodospirillales bacterium]|nr:B12-binding domain-containing radical SAM protein [Rhodospirillales bacterium]
MSETTFYKKPQDFRVLFVYPNIQMSALAPQGIGYLSAMLKQAGFNVDLFDSTFYSTSLTTDTNQEKVHLSIVKPFSWKDRNIEPKTTDMIEDFRKMVDKFQPDLIAVSVVENTWFIADAMMRALDVDIPTIVGGVFATYAPEIVIRHPKVDYLCRGDGELPLLALCQTMANGGDTTRLTSIWSKANGQIHRNTIGQGIAMDDLPFPDWDIFEEQSLYRPMQGRIYKTMGIETQRGCPYKCTFCNSPSNNTLYRSEGAGSFHRKKSVRRVAEELEFMQKHYGPEFIYFVVDTFLAMSDRELDEFSEMYQSFKIPFWMNTRAETVNEARADHLEKMNCLRMNIGIKHGNEEYRKRVLKRAVSNEKMLTAFQSCAGRSFTTVANSIIGLPQETRELAFDTIKFNRQLPKEIEASGAFIFTPYHGTPLRESAVKQGLVDEESICSLNVTKGSILDMPQFRPEDIQGLCRVFSFYVKMPEERWGEIAVAEAFSKKGEQAFEAIREDFLANYRKSDASPKDVSSFDLVVGSDEWEKSQQPQPEDFSDLH